jgi:hypothetical protein
MKTNYLTKSFKSLLAFTLLALVIGNAAAQVNLVSKDAQNKQHASIPGECGGGPGESF